MSKPKRIVVQARISEGLKDQFDRKLKELDITQSDFVVSCILNLLGVTPDKEEIKKYLESFSK